MYIHSTLCAYTNHTYHRYPGSIAKMLLHHGNCVGSCSTGDCSANVWNSPARNESYQRSCINYKAAWGGRQLMGAQQGMNTMKGALTSTTATATTRIIWTVPLLALVPAKYWVPYNTHVYHAVACMYVVIGWRIQLQTTGGCVLHTRLQMTLPPEDSWSAQPHSRMRRWNHKH